MADYPQLKLENQLCFPLYAAAKEIVRRYKPFLDPLDLTYTQYIAMMVMWDKHSCTVTELGEALRLDSGTLTPLLKKLESKGYITRRRGERDERKVVLTLTPDGEKLKDRAAAVPTQMGACVDLSPEDAKTLYSLLYKLLGGLDGEKT